MSFHKLVREGGGWERLGEQPEYCNPFLKVFTTRMRTPARPEGLSWTVVHRKAGAVVAPITAEGKWLLISQERVPLCATLWEFPAGQIDECIGEDPEAVRATALRELKEEAGHELAPGGELIAMGHFFTSPGFTDELTYLFLARPVVPSAGGKSPDPNESIGECRAFSPEEFRAMIARNEIRDANTLCAFARMSAMGLF